MNTLIIVEHNHQHIDLATRNMITAAHQLKSKPVLLIIGHQCQEAAKEAASLSSVEKVLVIDHPRYENPLAEDISALIVELAGSYQAILAPASSFGKNILPRVSALLGMAQISDVTSIINENEFKHPIYAGNAIETVQVLDSKKILTIRSTAFAPMIETQSPCAIETLALYAENMHTVFLKHTLNETTRPPLNNAKIVVSGGRGLQSKEQFKLIEALADSLGAAVGASRAAVDAGFVPNDYQVGQTGKVVAPDLYFAIGISGAVQHIAGMKGAKITVAINKDPDAPIFQVADYGLVGDLFELVPKLIEQIKPLKFT